MIKTAIRIATGKDAWFIANNLRPDDLKELRALQQGLPEVLVMETFECAAWSRVATLNDVPVILYGVCPHDIKGHGIPFMVATPAITQFTKRFVRGSIDEVFLMEKTFPKLINMVHKENQLSRRWLKWLGFEIDEKPVGPGGEFMMFTKGI